MALPCVSTSVFVLALAVLLVEPSTCQVLKGSVSCLDCSHDYDLSGIRVIVKCDNVKKLAMATTDGKGAFETELPSDPSVSSSSNCLAKLLGGPMELCSSQRNQVSRIVKAKEPKHSFTISTPLNFHTSCPSGKDEVKSETSTPDSGATPGIGATPDIGSSNTGGPGLPIPPEWGMPPLVYYLPILPIIGIP